MTYPYARSQVTEASAWVEALQSLDATACGFQHERSVLADPPICGECVREKSLGCAHGENSVLTGAIAACQRMDALRAERAAELHAVIRETHWPLLQLDMDAARSYENANVVEAETVRDQQKIVDRKAAVRDEVVECLRRRFAV
jgi:hypothetical protein